MGGIGMSADKRLLCKDCGQEFFFAAGEQRYYVEHGLGHEPQRCPACRVKKKDRQESGTEVACANCGTVTIVPFVPRGDRPIYCRECLRALRR
jgi:CxxC-x17-CxxC domain-containing protein